MSDEQGVSSNLFYNISVYIELKRRLAYAQVFLTIIGNRGRESISFNVRRRTIDVKWGKRKIHSIQFSPECPLFVPTTCHGIQWVSKKQVNFRVQVVEPSVNGKHECLNYNNNNGNLKEKEALRSDARNGYGPSKAEGSLDTPYNLEMFNSSNFTFDCIKCGVELLQPAKFSRVLALPSDSWYGVADSIFCHKHHPEHKSEETNKKTSEAQTQDVTSGLFIPKENECFVGETHFILNGAALSKSEMFYDTKSHDIKCSRCRFVVGLGNQSKSINGIKGQPKHSNGPNVQSLKVFTHSVKLPWRHKKQPAASKFDKIENASSRSLSLESTIAALIESQSKQYNGYRFVVEARQHNTITPFLLLWVLEVECEQYIAETNDVSKSVMTRRARILKVMYKDCIREQSKQLTQQWQNDLTVHSIELPKHVCLRLTRLLMDSTRLLPSSLATANEFYVGFLRKDVDEEA